jgi:hypothetical protein
MKALTKKGFAKKTSASKGCSKKVPIKNESQIDGCDSQGSQTPEDMLSKEAGSGLLPEIAEIRQRFTSKTSWGELWGGQKEDVLHFAWRDASCVVLFMSTIHTGAETVERHRRRPPGATQAIQAAWGGSFRKLLPIPGFIDTYNHTMNGVDTADQVRTAYQTKRRALRNWHPLWHFVFDTVLSNCAYIWLSLGVWHPGKKHRSAQRELREILAQELMQMHRSSVFAQPKTEEDLAPKVEPGTPCLFEKHSKSRECRSCQVAGRKTAKRVMKRAVLGEISGNSRPPRTGYACLTCDIAVCKTLVCKAAHLEARIKALGC